MRGYTRFSWRKGYRCLVTQPEGNHVFIKDNLLMFNLGKKMSYIVTLFIRLTALGAYFILGPWGWALIIFQTFSASKDILENDKTRDNKFISLEQNKTKSKI